MATQGKPRVRVTKQGVLYISLDEVAHSEETLKEMRQTARTLEKVQRRKKSRAAEAKSEKEVGKEEYSF